MSDMLRAELELFAESCPTGKPGELSAHNGNIALAIVYAALRWWRKMAKRCA